MSHSIVGVRYFVWLSLVPSPLCLSLPLRSFRIMEVFHLDLLFTSVVRFLCVFKSLLVVLVGVVSVVNFCGALQQKYVLSLSIAERRVSSLAPHSALGVTNGLVPFFVCLYLVRLISEIVLLKLHFFTVADCYSPVSEEKEENRERGIHRVCLQRIPRQNNSLA